MKEGATWVRENQLLHEGMMTVGETARWSCRRALRHGLQGMPVLSPPLRLPQRQEELCSSNH